MKKRSLKLLIGALTISMMSGIFVGCGNKKAENSSSNTNDNKSAVEEKYTGTITSLGSSALKPLAEVAAKNFMAKHSGATVIVQGGGSGNGIKGVVDGTAEIGNSDVPAEEKIKDENLTKDLVDHKVCGIGFGVVTSKDVTVESLTNKQIQDIFTGEVTNWSEFGGQDKEINVINRKSSSGTRAAFINTVMEGEKEKSGLGTTQPESGGVRDALKVTEGAISYLGLSYITEDVRNDIKVLKIDGVEATNENVISGSYPFWSYEHMYTKGNAAGLTKAFLDYMVSEENKAVVEKLGYIPMNELK